MVKPKRLPFSIPLAALLCHLIWGGSAMADSSKTVEAALNGLRLVIDAETGSIAEMSYPGVGRMLEASADSASVLDLAYPIKQFEPLRLASRFSEKPDIRKDGSSVTIHWGRLGLSRPYEMPGSVSATVKLVAAPDGRSVIASCEIENASENAVRQVLFPDFSGILPFAGEDKTEFRSCGFVSKPFQQLKRSQVGIGFYATDPSVAGLEYSSGAYFGTTPMIARWFDLGSLKGGISVFRKAWGWGPDDPSVAGEKVWLRLRQSDNRLRMACMHNIEVKPGEKWQSGEYWITPHTGGWAKGIEPYGEWVRQNCKRVAPVAKHVREGLGFRTLWMAEQFPNDPAGKSIVWRFKDLPELAKESKEHGIDEITLWSWGPYQLPFYPACEQLGGDKDLVEAAAECKKMGVNVNLFVSLMSLMSPSAEKYGMKPAESGSWTYGREFVPVFRPHYGQSAWTAWVDQSNQKWQDDVLESMRHYIDLGCCSFNWDQFSGANVQPNLYTLIARYQPLARAKDPESTFCGESSTNIEEDCKYMDYTWDWYYYFDGYDCRPFTSVFPSPRLNAHIDCNANLVKHAFMDNVYISVFTSKPDGVNGSARITEYPELSRALKQCAKLRKQFLDYFVEGTLIGDCILTEECPGVRVCSYVLPDRLLVIALNEGKDRELTLKCDLSPWLKSRSGGYQLKTYDSDGGHRKTKDIAGGRWEGRTERVKAFEFAFLEFYAH